MILTDESGKKWEVDESDLKEVKPKKAVDLAYLIESGIDCEFVDSDFVSTLAVINKLVSIGPKATPKRTFPYERKGGIFCDKCRPRMNHWHFWGRKESPLPAGFEVHLNYGTRVTFGGSSKTLQDHDWSIINAFKVIGLSEGYCYPWEVEA